MKIRNAFTLVDSMVALLVVMLGTGTILSLMERSRTALLQEEERAVAHRILHQLRTLPTTVLEQLDGQTYDFRGMHEGPALFHIRVQANVAGEFTLWRFAVLWVDVSGNEREINAEKLLWGGPQ